MSDENYLHALCAGDTQRIRSIYQQYAGQIQRWVEENNGSAADAQDLFQDGLIAIYDRYCGSDFQLSSSFGALLFGICKRKWFDRLKEKNRETVVRKVEEERYNDDHDPSMESEVAFHELQKQETLTKTFALLSAQCQQLLTLLGQGVAAEQIALQLRIANANAVYQSKHRCMGRWKELFLVLQKLKAMNNTEKIDRFLRDELPEEEKAFEAELKQNPDLAGELALQKDMEQFLRKQEKRTALKNQLGNIGPEFFQASAKPEPGRIVPLQRRQTLRWVIGLAAAIALLLVARFVFSPSLYDQFGQYPPLAMIEKSNTAQDNLAAMEAAFNQKDYAAALPLLQAYLREKPGDLQAELYLGICLLETRKYAEARAVFTKISQTESSFTDYGQWYLALSHLKEGDKAACRQVLQEVPQESEFFQKAQDLLKRV